mgnify:CR=1 FL=1
MVNYAAPLKVQARVFIHETGEVKEQEIFLFFNLKATISPHLTYFFNERIS